MDEVESIAGDDSLDLNPTPRKATSRSRKASGASRSRPRSAKSATAAANSSKQNGPGTAITAKSRGKVNRRQQGQGQGSRMRVGGDGASDNNTSSSSVPPLPHPVVTVVVSADTNGNGKNSITAARSASGSVEIRGGGRRTKTRKSTTNNVVDVDNSEALNQQIEDGEKKSVVEGQDVVRLLQQLESRNQAVESRCRDLEHQCSELEGVVKRRCCVKWFDKHNSCREQVIVSCAIRERRGGIKRTTNYTTILGDCPRLIGLPVSRVQHVCRKAEALALRPTPVSSTTKRLGLQGGIVSLLLHSKMSSALFASCTLPTV